MTVLHYVNRAHRNYGAAPVPIYPRSNWEFQAVLRGLCAPAYSTSQGEFATRKLWVFAPGNRHGWLGPPDQKCEIVVFHFDSVPKGFRSLVPDEGVVTTALSSKQCSALRGLYAKCFAVLHKPGIYSEIVAEHSLLSLCMIIAESAAEERPMEYRGRDKQVISALLAWYEENMSQSPTIRELARAGNVSESTLRRIFHGVLGVSPQQELLKRRIARAKFLLGATLLSASQIAYATGYGSLSTFSRVFTDEVGTPPGTWRRSHGEVARHFLTDKAALR